MSGKSVYGSSLKGMRGVFGETLVALGQQNPRIVVIDCETGTSTNAIGFKDHFPDRFLSMGVAEQNAVSFAFSLANSGFIPVLPLFASFLTRRACDQVFVQVGYARANIKLVGCYAGLTSPNTGATHQSINDIAIMRSIPNLRVVETADPRELRQALQAIVEIKGPVYLRLIRGDLPEYEGELDAVLPNFEIGKASVIRRGNDVTIMASGIMVARALRAASQLQNENGIDVEVINVGTIKPLDTETIVASLRKTGRAVIAENHSIHGGLGSAVLEAVAETSPVPTVLVGIQDEFGESGSLRDLLSKHCLGYVDIVQATLRIVERS